jgi:zinc transport system permease protein
MDILTHPFMLRALLSGALLAALLASLGIFVTLRKMAFFSDGIAHASLAGIAIAILCGWAPLPVALAWAAAIALIIWRLERQTRLSSDTMIGIFFTASMALGVILMSYTRGFQPELLSYLFGSILAIRDADVVMTAVFTAAILAWLTLSFRQLTYLSLAEESAVVRGVPAALQTAVLYVSLSVATVLGVKVLGIVLVSALLILPPATSRMLTSSFRGYFIGSIVLAELMVLSGLVISYTRDLPSGATIILVGTATFTLAALVRNFSKNTL